MFLRKPKEKFWKNILWDTPANYLGRHRVTPGTRRDFKVAREVDGLTLFEGLHKDTGLMTVYGIRYDSRKWTRDDAWRWWGFNKNKCKHFT